MGQYEKNATCGLLLSSGAHFEDSMYFEMKKIRGKLKIYECGVLRIIKIVKLKYGSSLAIFITVGLSWQIPNLPVHFRHL